MAEVLFGSNSLAENLADDLALSKEFVQDVLARYASEEEIAASNRRRKVVNIQSGRKRRMKSDIVMNPAIGSKG
jgi:5-methylcytosine-specific restriction endonuclease McrBC regulatory subunit McrC